MADTSTITEPVINTAAPIETENTTPSIIPVDVNQTPPIKDLISKVAEFKKAKATVTSTENKNSFFDYKEIENIADPEAKKFAKAAFDSMQSAFTKKTQEVAYAREGVEQKLKEMQNWSPERIQRELLNNPQFLQSAKQLSGNQTPQGTTDDQYSALSQQEKAQIDALKSKINTLEQSNFQAIVAQRDAQLFTRYPDYNSGQIDAIISDLAQMNPLDIREHVYKSLKHDEDVSAAYELGRKESQNLNQTKINAIGQSGNTVIDSEGLPSREKGETDQIYFMKMAKFRLSQFKNRK